MSIMQYYHFIRHTPRFSQMKQKKKRKKKGLLQQEKKCMYHVQISAQPPAWIRIYVRFMPPPLTLLE
jgi:hypothetical protein